MSTSANFASTPAPDLAYLSQANSNRDGVTGTYVTVSTGSSNGDRIEDIELCANGSSTTAGMIRLFIYDGTNTRLVKEVPVTANTPSASNPVWSAKLVDLSWLLKSGWQLRASTHNAETFTVYVSRKGSF